MGCVGRHRGTKLTDPPPLQGMPAMGMNPLAQGNPPRLIKKERKPFDTWVTPLQWVGFQKKWVG